MPWSLYTVADVHRTGIASVCFRAGDAGKVFFLASAQKVKNEEPLLSNCINKKNILSTAVLQNKVCNVCCSFTANSGTERHKSEIRKHSIFDFVKLMFSRWKVVASKFSSEGTGHSTVEANGVGEDSMSVLCYVMTVLNTRKWSQNIHYHLIVGCSRP